MRVRLVHTYVHEQVNLPDREESIHFRQGEITASTAAPAS